MPCMRHANVPGRTEKRDWSIGVLGKQRMNEGKDDMNVPLPSSARYGVREPFIIKVIKVDYCFTL